MPYRRQSVGVFLEPKGWSASLMPVEEKGCRKMTDDPIARRLANMAKAARFGAKTRALVIHASRSP
jgi:hypothetical protein